jgi:hypothetical protein
MTATNQPPLQMAVGFFLFFRAQPPFEMTATNQPPLQMAVGCFLFLDFLGQMVFGIQENK